MLAGRGQRPCGCQVGSAGSGALLSWSSASTSVARARPREQQAPVRLAGDSSHHSRSPAYWRAQGGESHPPVGSTGIGEVGGKQGFDAGGRQYRVSAVLALRSTREEAKDVGRLGMLRVVYWRWKKEERSSGSVEFEWGPRWAWRPWRSKRGARARGRCRGVLEEVGEAAGIEKWHWGRLI